MSRQSNRKKSETSTLLTGIFEATSSEVEAEREAALAQRNEKQAAREKELIAAEERRRRAGAKAREAEQQRLAALERKRRALAAKQRLSVGSRSSAGLSTFEESAPCADLQSPEETPEPGNVQAGDERIDEEERQLSSFQATLDAQRAAFEALRKANESPAENGKTAGRPLKNAGIWLALAAALLLAVSVAAVPYLGFGADADETGPDPLSTTAVPAATLAVTAPGSETRTVALARVAEKPVEAARGKDAASERDSSGDDRRAGNDDNRTNDRNNQHNTDDDEDDGGFGDLDAENPLEFRGRIIP